MKKYRVGWVDATAMEHYKDVEELREVLRQEDIKLDDVTDDGDWYDYTASHEFEADDDMAAIEYVRNYEFGYRNVDVFTLTGIETGLYFTEEGL